MLHFFAGYSRTNNPQEAWHGVIGRIIGCKHPNIYQFIEFLQNEQSYVEGNLAKAEAGVPPEPQKKKWKDLNRRIFKIVSDFSQSETKDYIIYLRSIAHNINFNVVHKFQTQSENENAIE